MPSKNSRSELEPQIAELKKRLAESQACLDFFGVDAPAGLVIYDQDCRYVQLNQFIASFTNRKIAEHIGKKPSEVMEPQVAAHIEAYVREIIATGEPQLNRRFTCAIPRGSQNLRYWRASRFPLRNSTGAITGVGVVVVEETGLEQLKHTLNQQNTVHQALLETIPARIFMKDRAGRYLYCNEILVADIGRAKAEIIGKNDFELFRPDIAERYHQADLEVIASGQVKEFEYTFEKNGRDYYIHVRKTPFRDAAGNILGILGIFRDLSEKRRAEQQLFIADHALSSSLAGIMISDPEGTITYANSAFLQLWGFSRPEEILGMATTELLIQGPVPAKAILSALQHSGSWQGELRGQRRHDGALFDALLTANVVKNHNGQVICLMGSMVDITARKAAERQLLNNEEQLRQITDNIDDAVGIMDTADNQMLYVSPAYEKIWGRPRESLFKDPEAFLEAVHPDDRELLISSRLKKNRERRASYRVIRPDGSIRQVFARIFPVRNVHGQAYREVGIIQDVTEMKEAEAKLLSLSRRLNNAVEEERSAIARDLHDEFGQALVRLRQWQKTLHETIPEATQPLLDSEEFDAIVNHLGGIIRDTIHRLRPDTLDNLGLAAAIAREVKEFGRRFTAVKATFQLVGQSRPIDSEHALVFYRVLQEALTNVARHAQARNLQVRLVFSFPNIILTVDDDGVGFDPSEYTNPSKDNGHWGLKGIGERMSTIGGRAAITSQPGLGTSVRAELADGQSPGNPPPDESHNHKVAPPKRRTA